MNKLFSVQRFEEHSVTGLGWSAATLFMFVFVITGCGGNSPGFSVDDQDGGDTASSDPVLQDPEIGGFVDLLPAADPKLAGFADWPIAFSLDPGDYDEMTCVIELSRDENIVRELEGVVDLESCQASWDGRDSEGVYLTPGTVDVLGRLYLPEQDEPVSEMNTELEVLRLGISEVQLSALEGSGERVGLLWAEMNNQAEGYWEMQASEVPWRIGPDSSEDAAAVDLELADGTPRVLPEPWTDLKSPPLDSAGPGGVEQDTFNMPTSWIVGTEILIDATLSSATAGNPDGYAHELVEVRVVPPSGTTTEEDGAFGHGFNVSILASDSAVPAVGLFQLLLNWTFEVRLPEGEWMVVPGAVNVTHNLYGVVGQPLLGNSAMPYRPWVEVVDQVANWVDGEASEAMEVAALVTRGVYDDTALYYDTQQGACHYTYYDSYWFDECVFDLVAFQRREYGSIINCTDAGAILSTYVNMVGIDFNYHILTNGNSYNQGFDLNYIMAIGGTEFDETPFDDDHGSFSYHAVTGPSDTTIYDSTLVVDGDGTPTAPPHTTLYPTGMTESDYLVALSSQSSIIDVDYDEKVSLQYFDKSSKKSTEAVASNMTEHTRAGITAQELLPEGLEVLHVEPPAGPGLPVKLSIGNGQGGGPLALYGVLVAASDADAQEALETWRRSVSRMIFPSEVEVGDRSYGNDSVFAFVRENVMVFVQTMVDDLGATDLAMIADGNILLQPFGVPFAKERARMVLSDNYAGLERPVPISFDPDYLAARVEVSGPGYARRTADGWVVVRTGDGEINASVTGVDNRLRVFR